MHWTTEISKSIQKDAVERDKQQIPLHVMNICANYAVLLISSCALMDSNSVISLAGHEVGAPAPTGPTLIPWRIH